MSFGRLTRPPAWASYAFPVTVAAIVYLAVPSPGLRDALYLAVACSAAAAVAAGVALYRPPVRAAWWSAAAGILLMATGRALLLAEGSSPGDAALASVSNASYLAGYLAFLAAILLLLRAEPHDRRRARAALLDALAVATAALVLGWTFLADPIVHGASSGDRAESIASLLLDVVLVAVAAQLLLRPGSHALARRLIVAGFVVLLAGDVLWRRDVLLGSSEDSPWFEILVPIAYALWGTAALHPSMRDVVGTHDRPGATLTRARLILLALLTAAVPIALAFGNLDLDRLGDLLVIALASALLPLLAVARLGMALGALRESEERFRSVFETALDAIVILDDERRCMDANPAACALFGLPRDALVGQVAADAALPGTGMSGIWRSLLERGELRGERDVELAGGTRATIEFTARASFVPGQHLFVLRDVSERRRQSERIEYVASHDALTDLPNRRSFEDVLVQAVKRARRGPAIGLLLVDIDNFKLVNDTAGHPAGDRFLVAIADILRASLRPGDFLARLGGDEFAATIENVSEEAAKQIAERMVGEANAFRFYEGGQVFDLGVSIGLCLIDGAMKPAEAMAVADSALHVAKEQGKNRAVLWGAARADRSELMLANSWISRIRQAIREDGLVLALQPVVDLETKEPVHFEALVRMRGAAGELVPPSAFLPAAVRFGLMSEVDRWVIDHTIRLLQADRRLCLFVNLAGSSLGDDDLFEWIESTLRSTRLEPGRLGIEITEKAAVRDMAEAARRLTRLRELGCQLALDDFGVDFASFEPLRRLPLDFVKIGDTFVRDLLDDAADRAIVQAITTVSHALGKRVIVEGVQSDAAADLARSFGIEYGQGFMFGPPDSARFLELTGAERERPVATSAP